MTSTLDHPAPIDPPQPGRRNGTARAGTTAAGPAPGATRGPTTPPAPPAPTTPTTPTTTPGPTTPTGTPAFDPAPTAEAIAAAVATIGAEADARSAELRALRRLPDDLYAAATGSGLFRQLVAAQLGGPGGSPLEWFRTGVALARHHASLAWVVTQGAAELGWVAAGADPSWAAEVLADPHGASASSAAGLGTLVLDGDGARYGGRWVFNTGCHGATWIGGLGIVAGAKHPDGQPVVRWAWVPADRAQILDDWDPIGLHGTGSNSTVIPEQEVDPRWTFDPFSPSELEVDRGRHRVLVGNGNWPIATSAAAVQLGNARRALDEATDLFQRKAPRPDGVLLATNGAVQRGLAEAEGLWEAGLASVERQLEAMWPEADAGVVPDERRASLHRANITATRLSVRLVDQLVELTGTEAVASGQVLGRCFRDAQALRSHIGIGLPSLEHNGRFTLGLEPVHRVV